MLITNLRILFSVFNTFFGPGAYAKEEKHQCWNVYAVFKVHKRPLYRVKLTLDQITRRWNFNGDLVHIWCIS